MKNRYILSAFALLLSATSMQTATAQDGVTPKTKVAVASRPGVRRGAYSPPQQPGAAPVNTDKSLSGQYQYLTTKVYNYQRPPLTAFYKNLMDTLRAERKKSRELQQKLSSQGKAVQDLQSDVNAKEQSLNESNAKADAISLAGIPVSKTTYNMIMWGLVILFGAVTTIVLLSSSSARREAKYRIKLYEELDEEYKAYKVKANEKEKKLARELQTERNKLEELLGRS